MTPEKIPATAAVAVEIRIGGRLRFVNQCYDVSLDHDDATVTLSASLNPTLIDAPAPIPRQPFGSDPRDGDEVITQIHSGRRDEGTP